MFTKEDLKHLQEMGISRKKVEFQLNLFKKGVPFIRLKRPCIPEDGIVSISKSDMRTYQDIFSEAISVGRAMKFVPASGAATRMFKVLVSVHNNYDQNSPGNLSGLFEENNEDHKEFLKFIKDIKDFAFFEDLKSIMLKQNLKIESLITKGHYKEILENILTLKGLNYAGLPKGLIKFHRYKDCCRTPIEEHLIEGIAYTRDRNKCARINFTVSPEHLEAVKEHIEDIHDLYVLHGEKYEITFSTQKISTNTIAVDLDNNPFRDQEGKLLFRPAGHGALLENLNDLQGDIIFIKNIDNVVPDTFKNETCLYKKILGGYLVELQNELFEFLTRLAKNNVDERFLERTFTFARNRLFITLPERIKQMSREEKRVFLFSKLNRPLRVCGMVRNEGEPGGGPFWVEHRNGNISLQIVERVQVDLASEEQRSILESSTHFNPVDLVCGVRDYRGRNFNLMNFSDPRACFISTKFKDGKELKALELPGLWNGAMANWNTVFVEVPIITFNPVKTVMDLLRKEHQMENIF
ncbi:MAG: DUF4301 family protein [Candidatus Brocadiaceae bacterium]|nr:DUF4301 family protein [Candidatus Brocadiaceae bacterium]